MEGEGEAPQDMSALPRDASAGLAEQVGSQQAFLRFATSWVSVKTQGVSGDTGAAGRQPGPS